MRRLLHLAVDADECALAVLDYRPIEQLDELRHQPLTEHRSCFEQRPKIVDEPSREGVGDHGHADRTHNGSRRGDTELRENHLAHRDDLTDLDHLILLPYFDHSVSFVAHPHRQSRWIKWM